MLSTLYTTVLLRIAMDPRPLVLSHRHPSLAKADYAPHYKHSLLYLACVDVATDLTADQRLLLAHDHGISASLGDTHL